MKLGIRAHDMGMKESFEEVARSAGELGFESVQLVLHKAVRNARHQAGELSPEYCSRIRRAFEGQGLEIALLGAYFNWFHDEGAQGKAKYIDHLRHAKAMGSPMVGTEVQGVRKDRWGHIPENESPEAWSLVLETAGELAEAAQEAGVLAGIEGACSHVLSTPRKVLELTEQAGPEGFALIFDLFNFLNQHNYTEQRRIIDEALELYGEKLAVVHCKDFVPKKDSLEQVSPGEGLFDYPYLIRRLKSLGRDDLHLIFEGVTGDAIVSSRDHILRLMEQ